MDRHVYAEIGGGTNDRIHCPEKVVARPGILCFDQGKAQFCDVFNGSSTHKVYYETHGRGETKVVLVMGLGGTHSQWEPQVQYFGVEKADEYTVVVVDNRGVGYSDLPDGRWKTTDFAADVLQVLIKLRWDEQVNLVGLSMGGMAAQELVLMSPQRFASVTLISTHAGGLAGTIPPFHGFKPFLKTFGSLEGYKSVDAGLDLLFPGEHLDKEIDPNTVDLGGQYHPEVPLSTNRLKHAYFLIRRARKYIESGHAPEITLDGVGRQLPAVVSHYVSWNRLKRFRAYNIPTLVISGKLDNLVGYWNSKMLSETLCARWIHFADAGHGVNEQYAEKVNTAMQELFAAGAKHFLASPHLVSQRRPVKPATHPWLASLASFLAMYYIQRKLIRLLSPFTAKVFAFVATVIFIRKRYGGFFSP